VKLLRKPGRPLFGALLFLGGKIGGKGKAALFGAACLLKTLEPVIGLEPYELMITNLYLVDLRMPTKSADLRVCKVILGVIHAEPVESSTVTY
jgi:hypothetical protein